MTAAVYERVYARIAAELPHFYGSVAIRLDPDDGPLLKFEGYVGLHEARAVCAIVQQEIGGG